MAVKKIEADLIVNGIIKKLGGTSSQFLKADGGVDSTIYVVTNDVRLSDARPASDVSAWAKAPAKPGYTKAEIGLGSVDNTADSAKSVNYANAAGSAPASDVSAWAKASVKPGYTKAEIGLGSVDNTADSAKSVNYANAAGSAPASDVSAWAKAPAKPGYTAAEVGALPLTQGVAVYGTSFITNPIYRGFMHRYDSGAGTATISNSGTNIGDRYDFVQWSTGQLTLVGDTGVTLLSAETLKTRKRYSVISVIKITATEWLVTGDLQLL